MKLILPAAAAAVLWVSAQATSATASRGLESAPPMAGAVETQTVVHDGATRTYRVVAPSNLPEGELAPVVLCFHGAAGTAQDAIDAFGIQDEAQARGWIAVFPEGLGPLSGSGTFALQSWNAGTCPQWACLNDVDDLGFVEALLQDLASKYPADLGAVCATGKSNGGMFCYRLASERPDLIDAIAPVAAFLSAAAPQAPMPTLAFYGLLDPIIPFETQLPTLNAFLLANDFTSVELVFQDPTALAYVAPGNLATTAYYLALDGGHTWPGGTENLPQPIHTTYAATPLMFDFWELELGL
jgi:polyhydroxybutyrate depolymerase